MPTIQFLEGSLQGQTFEVDELGATFGSSGRCELQIKDKGVASKHAQLTHDEGNWLIKDLRSKTGTVVNNRETKEAFLGNGDTVTMATQCFGFIWQGVRRAASGSCNPGCCGCD